MHYFRILQHCVCIVMLYTIVLLTYCLTGTKNSTSMFCYVKKLDPGPTHYIFCILLGNDIINKPNYHEIIT